MVEWLREDYGETPAWIWLRATGALVVFVSEESTWTMVEVIDSIACVADVGYGYAGLVPQTAKELNYGK